MFPSISYSIKVNVCCKKQKIIIKNYVVTENSYPSLRLFGNIRYLHLNNFFACFFRNHCELQDESTEERTDIVELLEAIAYLICMDEPVRPDSFHKILSSRGIPAKILRLADTNHDGVVSVEEMMNFIMVITNPR